jgi:DNA-binding SARP family transcriptional activator/tetratricopeptide (TPR) repeat protein
MWFGLLGDLYVRSDDGAEVPVDGARQRNLLAALLTRAGRVIPAAELADLVWEGAPPESAPVTLRSHVKRLRRRLGNAGSRIVTRGNGYLIEVGGDELDLLRFRELCRDGASAGQAGEWAEASRILTSALALWRGAPFSDISCEQIGGDERPGLEELWLQTLEWRIEADLRLGRLERLTAELGALTTEHPLRERFHVQLMLALYRSGRQAEALAAYQRARSALVGELGIEPGVRLREAHQQILNGPVSRADRAVAAEPDRGLSVVPRQLPPGIPHFVGRSREMEALNELLDHAETGGTVVISAIGGTAGIGKTALAVHWAHQVSERFPDGQLYVNLRGYNPSAGPVELAEAIRALLDALNVPTAQIPVSLEAQIALYRSLLADRRVLVLIDNARDNELARQLLPGSAGPVAIVTSRGELAGLVEGEGARLLNLDLLTGTEARELLVGRLGSARVAAEPGAVDELVRLCSRLPLALSIVAGRAAARPGIPLSTFANELLCDQALLDVLDAGDAGASVRAVFSWSYQDLTDQAARMFRLLSLHPGPDISSDAAASLAGISSRRAHGILDELTSVHILTEQPPGRFAFHDLLRAYAAEQARSQESEKERRSAQTRLLSYYLAAAGAAMDAVFPEDALVRPRLQAPGPPVPPVCDAAAGRSWLDAERANLVAIAGLESNDQPGHAITLAAVLFRYLDTAAHLADAQTICTRALHAARHTGDLAAQAESLRNLGFVDLQRGYYPQAARSLRAAQSLYGKVRDISGQARALSTLGVVDWLRGRLAHAVDQFMRALALFHEAGDRAGEGRTLNNLGQVERLQGRYAEAAEHHREALAISRKAGNRRGEANALNNLGMTLRCQGHYRHAEEHIVQALTIYRVLGSPLGEAAALDNLGHVCREQARYAKAVGHHRQALVIFRGVGDRSNEALALIGLGEALCGAGQPESARARHHDALAIARTIGALHTQALAHDGLGRAYQATGDHGQARHHWQQALTVYTDLGVPDADEVTANLETLPPAVIPPST